VGKEVAVENGAIVGVGGCEATAVPQALRASTKIPKNDQ